MDDRYISVTALTRYIKYKIDNDSHLQEVYLKGEISNFKAHTSGHYYFSLKDEGGVLRSVMFRSSASNLPFFPENGMKVIAHGRISAYVRDGQYQLYADYMEPDGIGSLYIAFEQLKNKLATEGLFDITHKKHLPKIPKRVGVITSPTGAAVRDIITVIGRRFPYAEIVIYPALVQGVDAPDSLCNGISYFNVDVIIIGRGGGSIEDLWAFNDERLARTIFSSNIPVVSAVGHETDYTICDFVSDVRAATPSAAAEIVVPDIAELKRKINNIIPREAALISYKIQLYKKRLDYLGKSKYLSSPQYMIEDKRMNLLSLSKDLEAYISQNLKNHRSKLATQVAKLQALNPMSVISRGYSAVFNDSNCVIKSVYDVTAGERISLNVVDGTIYADVVATDKVVLNNE